MLVDGGGVEEAGDALADGGGRGGGGLRVGGDGVGGRGRVHREAEGGPAQARRGSNKDAWAEWGGERRAGGEPERA